MTHPHFYLRMLLFLRMLLCMSVMAALLGGCAASEQTKLKPFESDGCTLFPDRTLISKKDWCSCCFNHDLAYWRGGTKEERAEADSALRQCIFDKTNNNVLANFMYEGVRVGGSPYFYNWYRWGYGWDFERKYQPLTTEEADLADKLAQAYLQSEQPNICQ